MGNIGNYFSFLTKVLKNTNVKKFIKVYGLSTLLQVISIIQEAEENELFQESGKGAEKFTYVMNKVKELLDSIEELEEGNQIPEWVSKSVKSIVDITNMFFK